MSWADCGEQSSGPKIMMVIKMLHAFHCQHRNWHLCMKNVIGEVDRGCPYLLFILKQMQLSLFCIQQHTIQTPFAASFPLLSRDPYKGRQIRRVLRTDRTYFTEKNTCGHPRLSKRSFMETKELYFNLTKSV